MVQDKLLLKKKSYFQYFFLSFLKFSEPNGATWRSPLFYNSFFFFLKLLLFLSLLVNMIFYKAMQHINWDQTVPSRYYNKDKKQVSAVNTDACLFLPDPCAVDTKLSPSSNTKLRLVAVVWAQNDFDSIIPLHIFPCRINSTWKGGE